MFLLLLPLLGCPAPDSAKDSHPGLVDSDSAADSADTQDSGIDTGTCEDVDGDASQTPDAPNCQAAGGVCVFSLDQCAAGEHAEDADSDCIFDDGDGYCCIPPAPAATGEDCASQGGVCAPIGGCGMVHGWYTSNLDECSGDWGVGTICCAPTDACAGWGTELCCTDDGLTAYVASCDRGDVLCAIDGTTLLCEGDCPAF